MITRVSRNPWAKLALAVLVVALLTALWIEQIPVSARRANADSDGRLRRNSRLREVDSKTPAHTKRMADPALVKQWMDELLERHPEARAEKWDVPDHENGHLAWLEFSERSMDGLKLPDCVSEYISNPNAENRKCTEEWLGQIKDIEFGLMKIAAFHQRSMGDARYDDSTTPGVKNISQAFHILLARGLIAADDGDDALALSAFSSALSVVRNVDGTEATSLLARVVAIGARAVVYDSFLKRIYPSIGMDSGKLMAWRDALSPGDTRDGLTRALIGENLGSAELLISSALSGEFDSITDFEITDNESKILIDTGFALKARVIAAVKSGNSLESIPAMYGQPIETSGLSEQSLDFQREQMEIMQSVVSAILKKETRLMMYDAALAAAAGEIISVDPVSGKPFLWDGETMTLSAPEGTSPQKPLVLPVRK